MDRDDRRQAEPQLGSLSFKKLADHTYHVENKLKGMVLTTDHIVEGGGRQVADGDDHANQRGRAEGPSRCGVRQAIAVPAGAGYQVRRDLAIAREAHGESSHWCPALLERPALLTRVVDNDEILPTIAKPVLVTHGGWTRS